MRKIKLCTTMLAGFFFFLVSTVSSEEARSGSGVKEQCKSCHRQSFDKWDASKTIHNPYKDGECLFCHSKEHKKFSQPTKKELCLTCHADLVKQDEKVIHAGFQMQECTVCHNPHASDFAKQLNRKESELCFGCHDKSVAEKHPYNIKPSDKVYIDKKKQWLTYEDEVVCTSCHNPHAAARGLLLREPIGEGGLCYECHKDKP